VSEAGLVFLLALLTAVATGLGALPFLFAGKPTRRWLGLSNAAAGLMLAASLGLAYEGALRGLPGVLVGSAIGFAFIVLVRRLLSADEHPAVFAGLGGLDARRGLLIVGVMTAHSFTEGVERVAAPKATSTPANLTRALMKIVMAKAIWGRPPGG
jgi:zinc transporter, ZIP family